MINAIRFRTRYQYPFAVLRLHAHIHQSQRYCWFFISNCTSFIFYIISNSLQHITSSSPEFISIPTGINLSPWANLDSEYNSWFGIQLLILVLLALKFRNIRIISHIHALYRIPACPESTWLHVDTDHIAEPHRYFFFYHLIFAMDFYFWFFLLIFKTVKGEILYFDFTDIIFIVKWIYHFSAFLIENTMNSTV